jgi:hypothetical protein
VFPILYVADKSKFYDTRQPKGNLLTLETAKNRLRSYDDKYHDDRLLEQAIRDIMDAPVLHADIVKSKKPQNLNWANIWELFREHMPLYKRTNNNGQAQYFYVNANNEVSKIDYTDDEALFNAVQHRTDNFKLLREIYNEYEDLAQLRDKMPLKPFLIKLIKEQMMADERHLFLHEPKQISWEHDEYAYKKMDSSLLRSGPTPTWDEFTARLDYPSVFMAWVWGIFESSNNIRQIMWLKGAGNDGKSSVQKAIESVIGKEYCYSMKPGDESAQWFQKNVFGKVLVNYADCRHLFLVNENNIKQLTGGDTTSIEGKGENAFTGKIYAKLFVTSNYCPKINPELQAHTTRLIKLEVQPLEDAKKDAGFEARLIEEIYPFLFKCRQAFEVLVSSGYERIELPTELQERIRIDCASETYLNVQDFVQEWVEFGTEQLCNPAELKTVAKDYFLLEKRLTSDQYKYYMSELESKLQLYGCSLIRHGDEGKQVTMWLGFKLKEKSNASKTSQLIQIGRRPATN